VTSVDTGPAPVGTLGWQLPATVIGLPLVVLVGFLSLLGRAGVGIQIGGQPLGALLTPLPTLIVLSALLSPNGRHLFRSMSVDQRRIAVLVGVALTVGVLRAMAQGIPTLLRFQDMAYLFHLSWLVVGMGAMYCLRSDEDRVRVLSWTAWTLFVVLGLHWGRRVLAPVDWWFTGVTDALADLSDKPTHVLKDGDLALFGIALATLCVVLTRRGSPTLAALPTGAGLLVGSHIGHFLLGGSRGALLGSIAGLITLIVVAGWRERGTRIIMVGVLFGLLAAVAVALSSPDVPEVPPSQQATDGATSATDRTTSTPAAPATDHDSDVLTTYEELAGDRSVPRTLRELRGFSRPPRPAGTVGWRLDIWSEVIEEWDESWSHRLFGIGFGTDIAAMTVPGRQGYDGLNRGVHSIAFTTIARQGLVGVTTLILLLWSLMGTTGRPLRSARSILVCGITVGLFDVFLEGVQAPIVLWIAIGVIAAADQSRSARASSA
jgi:hypothetical protein